MREIAEEAGEHVEQRHEVGVERHVEHTRVLLVERSDDGLRDVDRHEAGEEELVEEGRRVTDGREERRHDVSGDDKSGADAGSVVDVVELIPERLMQVDERGLGGTIVG